MPACLRERSFALLLTGQAASIIGDAISMIALPFAILAMNGSVGEVGAVLAARAIPNAILLLVGGVWADRLPRRIVMLASDITRGVLMFVVAAALLFDVGGIWALIVLMALYGAMLAGVNVVLMGAGIPRQIPKILYDMAAGHPAAMRLDVTGAKEPVFIHLDPAEFGPVPALTRPLFLAIVSSPVLAENLRRKASGKVDGFVVEGATAGGHNAPPRGPMQLTPAGEPIYGERDAIDPAKFVEKIGRARV